MNFQLETLNITNTELDTSMDDNNTVETQSLIAVCKHLFNEASFAAFERNLERKEVTLRKLLDGIFDYDASNDFFKQQIEYIFFQSCSEYGFVFVGASSEGLLYFPKEYITEDFNSSKETFDA